ncbi:MAG: zf-TFIIB domain-containing protein [Phycisphaerae bacterium]|nr:zf-TFIIB domain-containing protein [Phycisphaerae bacterium]
MKCPKCQADVKPVVIAGIEVERCGGCGGLWFDAGEAPKLKMIHGSEAIDKGQAGISGTTERPSPVSCPKCGTRMIQMVDLDQPHIHYEGCAVCYGMFFDAGEFRDYKEHTLLERLRDWWSSASR